jgi:hypothetical protein
MNPEDVTPEMYADWVNKTYSNVLNELAWAFTLMPAEQKEALQNSIYEDIIDGTYTPFSNNEL